MASIKVLQNVQCEPLGIITQALTNCGLEPDYIRPYDGEAVPRKLKREAGLIVLGGPMGVYEFNRYPWLMDAVHLIEHALRRELPILGICLGSQLLATALGATVRRGERKEIGWHPVHLTGDGHHDLVWSGAPASFVAYHWHGDVYDPPAGATVLASSQQTECQAFVHGLAAYGILFHLEITEKMVADMVSTFAAELQHEQLSGADIVAGARQHLQLLQQVGRTVFQNWATLCLEVAQG